MRPTLLVLICGFMAGAEEPTAILAHRCYGCHGTAKTAGLQLDSRAALLKGGQSGPAIVPGDPDHSLLIQAVRQNAKLKMPPSGKLPDDEVASLAAWVKDGAKYPDAPVKAAEVQDHAGTARLLGIPASNQANCSRREKCQLAQIRTGPVCLGRTGVERAQARAAG